MTPAPSTANGKLIPSKEAARFANYTNDYISRLCRQGYVVGQKVGKTWMVDEGSLNAFLQEQLERKETRSAELSEIRRSEYEAEVPVRVSVLRKLSAAPGVLTNRSATALARPTLGLAGVVFVVVLFVNADSVLAAMRRTESVAVSMVRPMVTTMARFSSDLMQPKLALLDLAPRTTQTANIFAGAWHEVSLSVAGALHSIASLPQNQITLASSGFAGASSTSATSTPKVAIAHLLAGANAAAAVAAVLGAQAKTSANQAPLVPVSPNFANYTSLAINTDLSVAGNLSVSGIQTIGGGLTVAGRTSLSGALAVAGGATIAGNETVSGQLQAYGGINTHGADINVGNGRVFASNIINGIKAGPDVTITGPANSPTISVNMPPLGALFSSAGTVTSVAAGSGLTGGAITDSGTISLNLGSANQWTALQTFNAGAVASSLGIGTSSPSALLSIATASSTTATVFNIANASSTIFSVNGSGSIAANGNAYFGGHVGIGMQPSASRALDIAGSVRLSTTSTFTLSSISSCAKSNALQTDAYGNVLCGPIASLGLSTAGGWSTDNVGHVVLATSTDAVGIGTSTPFAKLSVVSTATNTPTAILEATTSQVADLLDVYNSAGTLADVLAANGYLGIGTTTRSVPFAIGGVGTFGTSIINITNAGGINIVGSGCYEVNGSCIGGSGSGKIGTVTSVGFSGGNTGLTFNNTPITGAGTTTLSGTLNVANGGTGSTTLFGLLKGNGTSTVATAIPGVDYLAPDSLFATSPLSYSSTTRTFALTGIVPVANGGTGTSTQYASGQNYGIVFYDGKGHLTSNPDFTYNSANAALTLSGHVMIGEGAGSIQSNLAVGYQDLAMNTIGARNTANGYQALYTNTTGSDNTAIGYSALNTNNIGSGNTALGSLALSNAKGAGNTAVGAFSQAYNTTGNYNVTLGYQSGEYLKSGYGNVLVGPNPDGVNNITTGYNNIGIGYDPNFANPTGNNQLSIGNFLFGSLPATSTAQTLYPLEGSLGVASTAPYAEFGIQANAGSNYHTLFAIGSSTATATTTLFSVSNSGATSIKGPLTLGTALGIPSGGTGTSTGGVLGGVEYYNGSNLTNGAGLVFSNGRLGVGTSAPATTLDVAGTGRFTQALTLGNLPSCTGGSALQTTVSGQITCGTIAAFGSASAGGWITDLVGHVALATTTDYVGIGVNKATAKLDVRSTDNTVSTFALHPESLQTTNIIDIYNTSGVLSSVFTAGGNLGLGTTSPGQKLAVAGNTYISGSLSLGTALSPTNGGTGTSTAPTYGQLLLGNKRGGYDLVSTSSLGFTKGTVTSVGATTTAGLGLYFTGGPITGAGTTTLNGTLAVSHGGTGATSFMTGAPLFYNGSIFVSTSTLAVNVGGTGTSTGGVTNGIEYYNGTNLTNGANFVYRGGNLGLGTSSPSQRLSVGGNAYVSGALTLGTALSVANGGTGSTTLAGLLKGNGAGAVQTAVAGVDYLAPNSLSAAVPLAYDGATGRFTIATATAATNGFLTATDFTRFNGKLGSSTIASLTSGYLPSWTGSAFGNSPLYTNGTNVGVGTTSPSQAFTVHGNTYISGSLSLGTALSVANGGTGSTTLAGLLKGNGAGAVQTAVAGVDYAPATSGSTLLYGNGAGGFNNATVNGPLTFTGGSLGITQVSATTNGYLSSTDYTRFNGKLGSSTIASLTSGYLPSWTGSAFGNSPLYTNGTNVGVGTTSPGSTLAVGGNAYVSGNASISGALTLGTALGVTSGGTGLATKPSYGKLLVGTAAGTYALTATSSLGLESPLTFNAPLQRSGNSISIPAASASVDGYLSSADWTTFNNKVSSTSLSAAAPLAYNSATGHFTLTQATASQNGYLSSTDYTRFNGKLGSSTIASLTSGYLPKWNGSSFSNSLISDNGTNVGIGTTSPGSLLAVGGTSGINFTTGTSTFSHGLHIKSGCLELPDGGCAISSVASGGGITGGGAANQVAYFNSSNNIVSSGNLSFNGTKLGIGTSSPIALLSINPNTAPNSPAFVVGSSTQTDFEIDSSGNTIIPPIKATTGTTYCVQVNANGQLSNTGAPCAGTSSSGSGIFQVGPVGQYQTGSTQVLATSTTGTSATGLTIGLNITAASNVQTFRPTLSGTLSTTNGGTGATSFTPGAVLYGAGTSPVHTVSTTTLAVAGPFSVSGTLGALLGGTNATITYTGLATTSPLSAGSILASNGGAGVYGVSTSSPSVGLGLLYSGTLGSFIGGTPGAFTIATSSLYSGAAGQVPYFSSKNTLVGTSTIFLSNTGRVGIGSSTPGSLLAVGGANGINFTSATSTFNTTGGIAITNGCFSENGKCLPFSSGGTVTSVGATTTAGLGLYFTGGPITSAGTTTLSGTLAVAHGGTGEATQYTNGVTFFNGSKITSNSGLTFNGSTLSTLNDALINGVNIGRGHNGIGSNTAIGSSTLAANNNGYNDTAVGYQALTANSIGYNNTAAGYEALVGNTSGNNNASFGGLSLLSNQGGSNNAAFGPGALYSNVSSNNNTAAGYEALFSATGAGNTAFGAQAGTTLGTGANNTLLGYQAGYNLASGSNNIALGQNVDLPSSSGSNQLNIGNVLYGSGIYTGTTPSSAAVVGGKIGIGTTSPGSIFAIGSTNGINFTTGTSTFNTAGGIHITTGCLELPDGGCAVSSNNAGITSIKQTYGTGATGAITLATSSYTTNGQTLGLNISTSTGGFRFTPRLSGTLSVAGGGTGSTTLAGILVGNGTSALNTLALPNFLKLTGSTLALNGALPIANGGTNATSQTTNGVDYFNGTSITSNSALTFNGTTLITANDATIHGVTVGKGNGSIGSNTALGAFTLMDNTTGYENTAVGNSNLLFATAGNDNTAVGNRTLEYVTTGSNNTANGANAFHSLTTGSNNTASGYYVGTNITTGYGNTLLGANPDNLTSITTGHNNIGIGYDVNFPSATGSNQLSIGNTLFGTIAATSSASSLYPTNVSLGLGTTSPFAEFAIAANYGSRLTNLFAIGSSTASATSTLFMVKNNGNVGIGTTSPGSLLAVGGTSGINFTTGTTTFNTSGGIHITSGCLLLPDGGCAVSATGAGVLAIKQTYGTNQTGAITLASSTATRNGQTLGLDITNSGSTFSFTPTISGTLSAAGGGTGSTTLSGILVGNGISALNTLALPNFLKLTGSTLALNGALPIANGGTNATAQTTNGVNYFSGTSITSNSGLQYNGSTLSTANDAVINGLTVGRGSGNQGSNVAVGGIALSNNVSGTNDVAIGNQAGWNNRGSSNTAVGAYALQGGDSNGGNTGIGASALQGNRFGSGNVAVGVSAFQSAEYGAENTALGYQAGANANGYWTSNGNTLVGYRSGYDLTTGSDNIALGQNVDLPNNSGGQQLNVGNLIYGTGVYGGSVTSSAAVKNGTVGIGTSSPFAELSVQAVSGATNQNLFAIGASTGLATSTLFIVKNSGKVGIGTTSPFATLSVNGSLALTGALYDASSSAGTSGQVLESTGSGVKWRPVSAGGTVTYVGATTTPGLGLYFTGGSITTSGTTTLQGVLSVPHGGTGSTTLSGILVGNGTSALNTLALPNFLKLTGSTLALNTLGVSNGGTNASTQYTNGVNYFNGTSITSGSGLTYNGAALSGTSDATFSGVTVGIGGGTSATQDTALGYSALAANSGSDNTGLGYQALHVNSTGGDNTATGWSALLANTTGSYNTANGSNALFSVYQGSGNTALGASAGSSVYNGGYNTLLGYKAGSNVAAGSYNIALGANVLEASTTASQQLNIGNVLYGTGIYGGSTQSAAVALGGRIGVGTTTPGSIFAIGSTTNSAYGINFSTGTSTLNTLGGFNLKKGCYAENGTCIAPGQLGFGSVTSVNATTSANNFGLYFSGGPVTSSGTLTLNGTLNVAHGGTGESAQTTNGVTYYNGSQITSGTKLSFDGNFLSTTNDATFNGVTVGTGGGGSSSNTVVGNSALNVNTTGSYNTAVGIRALEDNSSGSENVAMGDDALQLNVSGGSNVAVGPSAGGSNKTGSNNTATGYAAFQSNVGGSNNTAFGYYALLGNTDATNTVAFGAYAASGGDLNPYPHFYHNQGGTYLGYKSGYNAGTGSDYNTLLGYQSGYDLTTGANNIALGANVDLPSNTASQQLNIGNLLYGTGLYNGSTATSTAVTGGTFGVATSSPFSEFAIQNNYGSTLTNLFAIGSSTSAASTTTLFTIDNKGDVNAPVSTATTTIAGGLSVGGGSLQYQSSTGITSVSSLQLGNLAFASDAGVVSWIDMPVTSASASGVVESYTANLNAHPEITVYGVSTGAGDVKNLGVGIGSTTPWGQLSVNSNNPYGPAFVVGSSTQTSFIITNKGKVGIGTTSPWAQFSVNPNGITGPSFAIGSSTKTNFVVTNAGNVGIGTSSPSGFFSVGEAPVTSGTGANVYISAQDGSGANGGNTLIKGGSNGGFSGGRILLGGSVTGNGGSVTISAGSGNNNSYPGNVSISAGSTSNNGGGSVSLVGGDGGYHLSGSVYIAPGTSGYSDFGNVLLGVDSSGNVRGKVGIGTTSPTALLGLQGAIGVNSSQLYLAANGKVGIGTTSPGSTLSVAGNSYTSGFINTSGITGGYKVDGNLILQASSTRNSVSLGQNALNASYTGSYDTAVGDSALWRLTTGWYNAAFGQNALESNTTGGNNTAVGQGSLVANTVGGYNVGVGNASLVANTTGGGNTAIGISTLYSNTIGNNSVAVGNSALFSSTGSQNTALGNHSGYDLTTGSYNIAIGNNVDLASSTASQQLNIGNLLYGTGIYGGSSPSSAAVTGGRIGIGTTTPSATFALSGNAYFDNGTTTLGASEGANFNNNFVYQASTGQTFVSSLVTGQMNFETDAGVVNWTDLPIDSSAAAGTAESYTANLGGQAALTVYGTANGSGALATGPRVGIGSTTPWGLLSVNSNDIGSNPAFVVGSSTATDLIVTNTGKVGIGTTSPWAALSVAGNVDAANYYSSGKFLIAATGTQSYLIGANYRTTSTANTGTHNFFVGYQAGAANTTGSSDNFIGPYAGTKNTTGSANNFLGDFAGSSNTTGSNNLFLGFSAGFSATLGAYNANTVVGSYANYNAAGVFASSTELGYAAGYSNSGNLSTLIGYQAGYDLTTGSYNIALGQNVDLPNATGNQQLNIGNLIYGSGIYNGATPSSAPVSGGKVGIGTTTPVSTLTVDGSGCFSVGAGATLRCGTTAGNIYYTAANTGNYDVAENYPSGNTIAAATLVGLNAAVPGSVGVATSSMPLLGVVSTAPGMLLGGADGTVAKQTQTAVALSGRVPVSVSAANGAIAVGDRLVLSSTTPGVAVKAVHSGETIGIALGAFSGPGTGKVSVFVSSQYWFAPQDLSINPTSGNVSIGGGTTTPNSALTVQGAVSASAFTVPEGTQQSFAIGSSTLTANIPSQVLTADGKNVDLYKLAAYNLSQVQQLALNQKTLTAKVNDLATRLAELENGSVAMSTTTSGTSFFSTSTLVSALNSFGVMIERGVAQFGTVVANQFVAATDSAGNSSAGTVTITASSTTAVVQNAYVKPTTKIFVTFNADVHGSWWVSDKQNGSFTVSLSQAQGQTVTFDYFLVQTQGQIATSTPDGVFPGETSTSTTSTTQTSSAGTGPVITLLGANPMHVLVGAPFSDPGYTVTDSIDGTDPVTTYINGNQQVVSSSTISTAAPATYIITYSAVDSAGNRTSVTRSVIVGNPDGTVSTGSTSTSGSSSASGSTTTSGGSTTATTGTGTKTATKTSATATTTTAVKDTTAPVVTLNGAAAMQITQGGTFTDPGATATDNVDGNLTSKIIETGKVDTSTVGLYTLTYSATDAAGNTGSASRVVSIVAPQPITTSATASSTPSTTSATASVASTTSSSN